MHSRLLEHVKRASHVITYVLQIKKREVGHKSDIWNLFTCYSHLTTKICSYSFTRFSNLLTQYYPKRSVSRDFQPFYCIILLKGVFHEIRPQFPSWFEPIKVPNKHTEILVWNSPIYSKIKLKNSDSPVFTTLWSLNFRLCNPTFYT